MRGTTVSECNMTMMIDSEYENFGLHFLSSLRMNSDSQNTGRGRNQSLVYVHPTSELSLSRLLGIALLHLYYSQRTSNSARVPGAGNNLNAN